MKTRSQPVKITRRPVAADTAAGRSSLHDVFVDGLSDLYDAENQLIRALPVIAAAVSSPELKKTIEARLRETRQHVKRLDQVFQEIAAPVPVRHCDAMESLLADAKRMAVKTGANPAGDAGIVATAQRVEHYRIACYGCVCSYCKRLGYQQAAELLGRTLNEETKAYGALTEVKQTAFDPELSQVPVWKRALDGACILLALPSLLPVMVVIAVMIKLVSRGPVFFKQERIGFLGRRFQCYKFRTMSVTSDPEVHRRHVEQLMGADLPLTKMDATGDTRLIPLGWLLRATGLDELPQVINVWRGEMSLVGPRPCLPFEYERYPAWQRERFNTLPGLTGLWQVSGKNHTTFTEMLQLDIQYARSKTLGLDLKILLMTLPAVISQTRETAVQRIPLVSRQCETGLSSDKPARDTALLPSLAILGTLILVAVMTAAFLIQLGSR